MGPTTVIDTFARSSSNLVFDDGTRRTASDLLDEGRMLAGVLGANGVRRGDRVALRLPNGVDYVRLLLACAAGGFVAVSVNTRYSPGEVDDLIERSGATRVEVDDRWRESEPVQTSADADEPYLVFTTSGTTSTPKMVVHSQRSIAVHAHEAALGVGYDASDVALVAMPLCGTFGLTSMMAAVAGDTTVVVTDFELSRTARLIAEHQVSVVNGSDDMFHRLIGHGADLGTIRLGGTARFNSSLVGVVADAEHAGATLTGLYGMSEVQAMFSVRDPELGTDDRRLPGGTLVSPAAAYRVVDDELQVRGPSLMLGYLADGGARIDHELTGAHFDGEWFRTGDLAAPEGERTFEFLTRAGDALRLGGFLVNPVEIESVITALPGVHDAQVVAVDRPDGARPVAFVIGRFDEAAVIAACRDRLAIHKVPIRVVGVAEFPTTPSANGTKIQRTKLRDLAETLLASGS